MFVTVFLCVLAVMVLEFRLYLMREGIRSWVEDEALRVHNDLIKGETELVTSIGRLLNENPDKPESDSAAPVPTGGRTKSRNVGGQPVVRESPDRATYHVVFGGDESKEKGRDSATTGSKKAKGSPVGRARNPGSKRKARAFNDEI